MMPNEILICYIIMLMYMPCCLSENVSINDLGVYGNTFPIQEVDIRVIIKNQLKAIDWNIVRNNLVKQSSHWVDGLPSNRLPTAKKTIRYFVDPSIALGKSIIVSGKELYHKGDKINPLDYVRPHKKLFFFNGNDISQKRIAKALLRNHPHRVVLIVTEGSPLAASKLVSGPVYYAFSSFIHRLHIRYVPSLVGVGVGNHKRALSVTAFSSPYNLDIVEHCWDKGGKRRCGS